jgi:nitrite reductase/ring-hydroxylating ferredoxin subunit
MRYLYSIFFVFVLFSSCGKDDGFIPDVAVNFNLPLTDPRLSRLSSPGGAVLIPGYGIAGIVIYRKTDYGYVAFDRCSTVNPEQKCAVTLDDPTLTVTDPCSGAKFLLEDGSPVKAPAVKSLRQYTVAISGLNLHVTN